MDQEFSITELSTLSDLSLRTIRFYIQQGLVAHPRGEKKAAKYGKLHLDQLLTIKKWQAAGLSLERIRELLTEPNANQAPPKPKWSGMVEVWSHVHIADGVELHLEPSRASLSPEQLRAFLKEVMSAYENINQDTKK